MNIAQYFKNVAREEDGVTAIEYGLIAALIAVVIIVSVKAVGVKLDEIFNRVATELDAVV